MKKLFTLFSALALAASASAQLNGSGYYRVQNNDTERYLIVVNNYAKTDVTSTSIDMAASLHTVRGFDTVASDAASVLYFKQIDGQNKWVIYAQGTDTYAITGYYLKVGDMGDGTYTAYASANGMTKYVVDEHWNGDDGMVQDNGPYKFWRITPLTLDEQRYYAANPKVQSGDYYWQTYFTDFNVTSADDHIQAFTVSEIDADQGIAIIEPAGKDVAANTPVVLRSTKSGHSDNRFTVGGSVQKPGGTNLLKGVFFDNEIQHPNFTANDPSTMRLIGLTANGEVGFVKSSVKSVPRNTAYLKVGANCPADLKIMTREEYTALQNMPVTVTVNSVSRTYGDPNPTFTFTTEGAPLKGTPQLSCAATAASPVGDYEITASRGSVTNPNVTFVAGKLTVTRAPLTLKVGDWTKKQGDPLPNFKPTYEGFRLNDTEAVLTAQPVFTCGCSQWSVPENDRWPVTAKDAAAQNYDISYKSGWLQVVEGDPMTVTVKPVNRYYGDETPQFELVYTGGPAAQSPGAPVVSCEATTASPVGSYTIHVDKGTLVYTNVTAVDATLTVSRAPLLIRMGEYVKKQGDPLPDMQPEFEGFKLGETREVLTAQPVVYTGCKQWSQPEDDRWPVTVKDAAADNYAISYQNGWLQVVQGDPITVRVDAVEREYGDPTPAFTYTFEGGPGIPSGKPELSCEATESSDAGVYAITIGAGSLYYSNLVLVDGTLTITPAPLTVMAGNYAMTLGEAMPEFRASYEGWKLNDSEASLVVKPTITYQLPTPLVEGEYELTVAGAESPNYTFTYENGVLTVFPVNGIASILATHPADIYTLTGLKVRSQATTTNGLRPGVYVVNGQKVLVK